MIPRRKTFRRRGARARCAFGAALAAGCLVAGLAASGHAGGGGDLLGEVRIRRIEGTETMLDIARSHDLGFVELMAANPEVDPWMPAAGTEVVLPDAHVLPDAPREGIVVNMAELRLYYFPPGGSPPRTVPIGIGRLGMTTPLGATRVVRKRVDPTWIPTTSTRADRPELPAVVPPGPDNPLGKYALDLGWPTYVIHGTNMPWGVGRRVSRGCIRLYPEDIENLFPLVAIGTKVTVVDESAKVGWHEGELYLEVHPAHEEVDEIEETGRFTPRPIPDLDLRLLAKAGADSARIDWKAVRRVEAERRGVPVRITR